MRRLMARAVTFVTNYRFGQIHFAEAYAEKWQMLRFAFTYVAREQVAGDYLEFGVFTGRTFVHAYRAARQRKVNCRFWAFDSFQGLPKPAGVDAIFERFQEGQLSASLQHFERRLRRHGVDRDRVVILPGWFNETLTEATRQRFGLTSACIVWIDCDLYDSTVPVLEFITPLLRAGTIILFDDWYCFRADPDKGEQRAAREWLARYPGIKLTEWRKFGINGQAFIVHQPG